MTLTADGTTLLFNNTGEAGEFLLKAQGTFDSGTLKLQRSLDGGTTKSDITDASLTASGDFVVAIGKEEVYVDLSGAGTPSITVQLDRLS